MKAKFGAIVVAGSGKVGGHVASRNRAGAYFRTKVTPVNPQSSYQVEVRNRLTVRSQAWRGLTEAQRAAWNAAVSNFATTDVFGDLKNPTGFNLYQKLNNNLSTVGAAVISVPPIPAAVSTVELQSAVYDISDGTFDMTLSGNVPAGTAMKIWATPGLSAGISFVKSEYRLIGIAPAATVTPYDFEADYVAKFGTPALGQKIFIKVTFVNTTTGQESTAQQVVATVQA
jgi:hypothetical protein